MIECTCTIGKWPQNKNIDGINGSNFKITSTHSTVLLSVNFPLWEPKVSNKTKIDFKLLQNIFLI